MSEVVTTLQEALLRAATACERGHFAEAERLCAIILQYQPDLFAALYLLAIAQSRRGDFALALSNCDRALAIYPDHVETLHLRGILMQELKRLDEAVASYDRALAMRPDSAETHYNRAVTLHELRRYDEALFGFDRALTVRPSHAATLNNRGNTLHALERFEEALASYDRALAIEPDRAGTFSNRGYALQALKRFGEAQRNFEAALALDPTHPHALAGLAECALKLCDWARRHELSEALRRNVTGAMSTVFPFVLLGYSDDASLQLSAARQFIENRIPAAPPPLWRGEVWSNNKIKVAYISADFRAHPVAHLIAELIELHDRSRFEVIGISMGADDRSEMRARLAKAFDRFLDVRNMPDREVAAMLNDLQTDIVIDLSGYTMDCRPEILAWRPAPIAVNYLGYPGTMGAGFVDYIIADPIAVPFAYQPYFSEKIVHLPDCYQANDRKRAIAAPAPSRQACGLSANGVVFCCFNSSWKISPSIFDIWMRLLKNINGSELWLLHEAEEAKHNLCREAARRGIDPARLVFAERLPPDEHLARHQQADLFLDTLPYNAHTTASDALWAGVPIVTCLGESFAARIAASLLNAVGLSSLITSNLEEYEALALKLATDSSLLSRVKQQLAHDRLTHPLFDSIRFSRNIEAAYEIMWSRWQRRQAPRSFAIEASVW